MMWRRLPAVVWGREWDKCLELGVLQLHLFTLPCPAEASWFCCLMVWFCLACEGSWKWQTSAQLWKWAAAAAPGGGCDTRLIVPSRQPLESPLWTSEMLTVACRVTWLWLRVTSWHENRQGVLEPFEGCIKMLDDFRGVELSPSCCPGLCL